MAGFFRYLGSLDLPMRVIENSGDRRVEAYRRPLGVVGAIIPWNYPLLILASSCRRRCSPATRWW